MLTNYCQDVGSSRCWSHDAPDVFRSPTDSSPTKLCCWIRCSPRVSIVLLKHEDLLDGADVALKPVSTFQHWWSLSRCASCQSHSDWCTCGWHAELLTVRALIFKAPEGHGYQPRLCAQRFLQILWVCWWWHVHSETESQLVGLLLRNSLLPVLATDHVMDLLPNNLISCYMFLSGVTKSKVTFFWKWNIFLV